MSKQEVAMFDAAYADLMKHVAWQPPAISREFADPRLSPDEIRKRFLPVVKSLEQGLAKWKADGAGLREAFWAAATADLLDDRVEADIAELIVVIESKQASAAQHIAEAMLRFEGAISRAAISSPSSVPILRRMTERLKAVSKAEIEARLDFALYLRALRSEVRAQKAGGRKIVKVDVDAYLRSLAAG